MKKKRLAIGTLGLIVAFFFLSSMERGVAEEADPRASLPQENSIWVQSTFFRGYQPTTKKPLDQHDIDMLARQLKGANIKYAYFFAGPYAANGTLPKYAFSTIARESVKAFQRAAPDVKILPWVGGLQDHSIFLEKPEWRRKAVQEAKRLVEHLGVTGIHFDFEYILPESTYVIRKSKITETRSPPALYHPSMAEFFREFRQSLPSAYVSTVFPATASKVTSWKAKPTLQELITLSAEVNQVVFIYFDTSIKDPADYQLGMWQQLNDIKRARAANPDKKTEFLLAFGTFVNEVELHTYRDLAIEDLAGSFQLIKDLLRKRFENQHIVDGYSIYCDWETDEQDWRIIREAWTTNPEPPRL